MKEKTKLKGEIAEVYFEDYDENGILSKSFIIESEYKGTLFKWTKDERKNK